MTGFLAKAMEAAAQRTARWCADGLLQALRREAPRRGARSGFGAALQSAGRPAVIAEFKRASPSRGPIAVEADPAKVATAYARGGAAAISVLTESQWFGGSLEDLRAVRMVCDRPILRKDFLFDEYDLQVSAAAGADAVLLIAAAFETPRLADLVACATQLGVDALVEAHDQRDLESAEAAGARLIGINSRNLGTLEVNVAGALRLLGQLRSNAVKILESGLRSRADLAAAGDAGADAVLIGEHLMRSGNPEAALRELLGLPEVKNSPSPRNERSREGA